VSRMPFITEETGDDRRPPAGGGRAGAIDRPRHSIRWALMRDLLVTSLALFLSFLVLTGVAGRRAVSDLAELVVDRTVDQVRAELDRFIDPVASALRQVEAWWAEGVIDIEDDAAVTTLVAPLFGVSPQLSAVILADERGRALMVHRTGDGASIASRIQHAGSGVVRLRRVEGEGGEVTYAQAQWTDNYDLRERPWYRKAVALLPDGEVRGGAGIVGWTEPYLFLTQASPGVTGAAASRSIDGSVRVVAVDVLIDAIDTFTSSLRIGERGQAAVFSDDGRVIGAPRDARLVDAATEGAFALRGAEELGMPLTARSPEAGVHRFISAGEAWWGEVAVHPLGEKDHVFVAVAIPESELLGGFLTLRSLVIFVTAIILAGAIVRSLWLASRFSGPIRGLLMETERFSRGDLAPGTPIVSDVEELVRLDRAHEQMRQGLVEMMRMERDLRLARDIQKQTMPDRLPSLPGVEIAAWNEPADETGGDAYDVISCVPDGDGGLLLHDGDGSGADRVVLLLADATGHGIGPALCVTQVRAMLRMSLRTGVPFTDMIDGINRQLHQDLGGGRFVTAWFGELDLRRRALSSFSAGQGPVLHYRAADRFMEVRAADTVPLGVVDALKVSRGAEWVLDSGDIVAVISDGIFEERNAGGEQFGVERVTDLIAAHASEPVDRIAEALRDAVDRFRGDARRSDDATVILIRAM